MSSRKRIKRWRKRTRILKGGGRLATEKDRSVASSTKSSFGWFKKLVVFLLPTFCLPLLVYIAREPFRTNVDKIIFGKLKPRQLGSLLSVYNWPFQRGNL